MAGRHRPKLSPWGAALAEFHRIMTWVKARPTASPARVETAEMPRVDA